jgi:HSP20 family protein
VRICPAWSIRTSRSPWEAGVLTIKGHRKEEREEKDEDYHCCERWAGSVFRSLALHSGVEADKIAARFRNGCWGSTSRRPSGRGKKIEIRAE